MITVSLCMIVKNEEDTLSRCLASVKGIADEIIIADTGSDDRTKEIALSFTDKIYDYPWHNHFSDARNFSFSKATMDYCLWLDADDIILPEDAAKFIALKESLSPDTDAVMMKYVTATDENGNPTFSYFRERLVKRERQYKWHEPVHEYLETGGKVINCEIAVTHAKPEGHSSGTRNLDIYESILKKGEPLSLRGQYYYARELKDHARHGEAIEWFEHFLDNESAWCEDRINACMELSRCYQSIDKKEKALQALTRSFTYQLPRGETCCQIGYFYKEGGKYREALFWFELAATIPEPQNSWGFIQPDCYGYIPCLECAVCYDKLANYEKAVYYNEKASVFKPDSKAVAFNRAYFAKLLSK